MKLIAQKPCSFAGKQFYIGDEIPASCVANPKAQEKMGVLAIAGAETPSTPVSALGVSIHTDKGDMLLTVSQAGLQAVFDALTSSAGDAERIVAGMDDGDALILLHRTDSRKTIKTAAEARAKALEGAGEA